MGYALGQVGAGTPLVCHSIYGKDGYSQSSYPNIMVAPSIFYVLYMDFFFIQDSLGAMSLISNISYHHLLRHCVLQQQNL